MIQSYLATLGLEGQTVAVLLFFAMFFSAAVAWVFRSGGAHTYERMAVLPLTDEEERDAR